MDFSVFFAFLASSIPFVIIFWAPIYYLFLKRKNKVYAKYIVGASFWVPVVIQALLRMLGSNDEYLTPFILCVISCAILFFLGKPVEKSKLQTEDIL